MKNYSTLSRNTKYQDRHRTEFSLVDYRDKNVPSLFRDEIKPFQITDSSLKNAGIRRGKKLLYQYGFEVIKDEGCLFIISHSSGDIMARFVEFAGSNELTLIAANKDFPDLIVPADEIEVIGLVVPRIGKPIADVVFGTYSDCHYVWF